ncbi:hypothetical protein [Pectobacterium carotovorum]|uniref:hypothetical protein n=1 Tax=Pectobacterium carotovorum TaxID=554 RepID=UPI0021F38684|nr:hypothetical protein [Pectobacterium carotovorum]
MNINELTIGQAKELASLFGGAKPESPCPIENGERYIVTLQRGWVVVGNVTKSGDYLSISNAAVIERWGTTDGLGQLAISGPTSDTRLRKTSDLLTHELTVVHLMRVQNDKL